MYTHACTLKRRPAVLPQDAVFQLFKPRLKLAAQPLEGKAGRIPVITVWLVEWLQLASLKLEDLHTYKNSGKQGAISVEAFPVEEVNFFKKNKEQPLQVHILI